MKNKDNRRLLNFASFSKDTRGRNFKESNSDFRTVYQRDRDRILHSSAFRRLKHKTQVFFNEKNEYYRTRLTHTIEVSQIARSLSYALSVNEDLAEAIALAHDLGHPPFGHAGEEALNTRMKKFGGFDHNEQSLRVVILIENKYINFNGLNLSWETIEGLAKHNGKIFKPRPFVKEISESYNFKLDINPSIEAQIASISDDIAYISHDFDDGFNAGLLPIKSLIELPRVGEIIYRISENNNVTEKLMISEMVRKLINELIKDIIDQAKKKLSDLKPKNSDDIRNINDQIIKFSEKMFEDLKILRSFLNDQMWRHKKIEKHRVVAKNILFSLFDNYIDNKSNFDFLSSSINTELKEDSFQRLIADNLANMTDNEARVVYKDLVK